MPRPELTDVIISLKRPSYLWSIMFAGLMVAGCASLPPAVAPAQLQDSEADVEASWNVDEALGIESQADRILREMSAYLSAATAFTFHADITYDNVVDDTQMIQYGGTAEVSVRRRIGCGPSTAVTCGGAA